MPCCISAQQARLHGQDVKVSNLTERRGTDVEKGKGFDLADYLTAEQKEINQYNNFVDSYNAKLETVLNNESLFNDFNLILDEQKARSIYNGGLSDTEAERICTQPQNLRNAALNV